MTEKDTYLIAEDLNRAGVALDDMRKSLLKAVGRATVAGHPSVERLSKWVREVDALGLAFATWPDDEL